MACTVVIGCTMGVPNADDAIRPVLSETGSPAEREFIERVRRDRARARTITRAMFGSAVLLAVLCLAAYGIVQRRGAEPARPADMAAAPVPAASPGHSSDVTLAAAGTGPEPPPKQVARTISSTRTAPSRRPAVTVPTASVRRPSRSLQNLGFGGAVEAP
jgi:hypothetical protein